MDAALALPAGAPPAGASPLFAEAAPFATHRLAVGDGHVLHVEECGRADGIAVVFLHGGPGSGCSPRQRRLFDPARFRAVLFEQRGAGRSTPSGGLRANTTAHLVADIERIRAALAIERWIVFGGSWGSLLALEYACAHPDRVAGLVLRGIFLASAAELRAYVGRIPPQAPGLRERLEREARIRLPRMRSPQAEDDLLAAWCRCTLAGRPATQRAAARHWLDHERALMGEPPLPGPPDARELAKARIQAHYLAHGCFTDAARLLAACAALRHLPAAIVHGADDPVCPPATARALHRALPEADYVEIPGAGHAGLAPEMATACIAALDRVATRAHPGHAARHCGLYAAQRAR